MAKVFNLRREEEITSVIERLWETGEEEVFLAVPAGSILLKNIIGLKLLKREVERLGKEVVLITKDEVGREMAKRVGLVARVSLPKGKEIDEKEEEEVFKEVSSQKFETFIEEEVKAKRQEASRVVGAPRGGRMSDIRPKSFVEVLTRPTEPVMEEEPEEEVFFKEEETIEREETKPAKSFWEATIEKMKEAKGLPPDKSEEDEEEGVEELTIEESVEEKQNIKALSALDSEDDEEEEKVVLPPIRLMGKEKKGVESFFAKRKDPGEFLRQSRKAFTFKLFSTKFIVVFVGAVVLIAAVALYFILPKAEVVITPKTEAVSEEISFVADKGTSKVDATQNRLPAQLIRVDKKESREFEATGQRQLNEKAKGTIAVYNEYSSSAQALVEKTRFVSESGKVFRTTKTITVPGAKIQDGKIVATSLNVDVVADQAGEEYNVGAGRFTIPGFQGTPKYAAFYGVSKVAMAGGAVGIAKVVSQDDFDKAKADVWQTLQPNLDKEFRAQIPSGLKMLDGSFREESGTVESSPGIGSRADKFTLTLKGAATVILFDEKDVLELLKKKLGNGQPSDNQELKIENSNIVYSGAQPDFSKGQMSFKVKIDGRIVWKIDQENLRKLILGKSQEEIKQIFNGREEIEKARVSFWPFWVSSVPSSADKVKISESLD